MFVTIVFNEVRPKVKCIHTKMIIVCCKLQAVKKETDCLSSMLAVFGAEARKVKCLISTYYDIT